MCKSWCQPFNLGAHHYCDFKGVWEFGQIFCGEFFFFFFSTPKVGDYFVFKSHKWVRFSCFCFCFLFCFVFFFVLFFLQNVPFPHHTSRIWLIFLLLLPKILSPLDIKWCALILILLQRWWWTLRHRQFWIPVQFSEKSNFNLKLH